MSFATCCPSCRTTFRVVRDQLKVSEGWVRCGRCGDVFCALDGLFELDRQQIPPGSGNPSVGGQPPSAPAPAAAPQAPALASRTPAASLAASVEDFAPDTVPQALAARDGLHQGSMPALPADPLHSIPAPEANKALLQSSPAWRPTAVGSSLWTGPESGHSYRARNDAAADAGPDFVDARFDSTLLGQVEPESGPQEARRQEKPVPPSPAPQPLESETAQPSFATRARSPDPREGPVLRVMMRTLAGLLLLLLALQVALQQRDLLAARVPAARPWLEHWCRWNGCELGALRRIDDLVLDHSALSNAESGGQGYRLSLLLRNRGEQMLALPAFELTLTDSRGQLVARRVLLPSDFGSAAAGGIGPRTQMTLELALEAPGGRAAGYTVEAFYP